MAVFEGISADELTYLASTISVAIAKKFSTDDVATLSQFFGAVSENLGLISQVRATRKAAKSGSSPNEATGEIPSL